MYAILATIALIGQADGLMIRLDVPDISILGLTLPGWVPAAVVAATIELVAVALLTTADLRRVYHKERALLGQSFAFLVALMVAAINFFAHAGNPYRQALFTGASLVAFGIWSWRASSERRDALIAAGDMAPPAPLYPMRYYLPSRIRLTIRARELAKRNPDLGLYGSLEAAEQNVTLEGRHQALRRAIERKLSTNVDRTTASIATSTYDIAAIAEDLANRADNSAMAALLAEDLTPRRLTDAVPVRGDDLPDPPDTRERQPERRPAGPPLADRPVASAAGGRSAAAATVMAEGVPVANGATSSANNGATSGASSDASSDWSGTPAALPQPAPLAADRSEREAGPDGVPEDVWRLYCHDRRKGLRVTQGTIQRATSRPESTCGRWKRACDDFWAEHVDTEEAPVRQLRSV